MSDDSYRWQRYEQERQRLKQLERKNDIEADKIELSKYQAKIEWEERERIEQEKIDNQRLIAQEQQQNKLAIETFKAKEQARLRQEEAKIIERVAIIEAQAHESLADKQFQQELVINQQTHEQQLRSKALDFLFAKKAKDDEATQIIKRLRVEQDYNKAHHIREIENQQIQQINALKSTQYLQEIKQAHEKNLSLINAKKELALQKNQHIHERDLTLINAEKEITLQDRKYHHELNLALANNQHQLDLEHEKRITYAHNAAVDRETASHQTFLNIVEKTADTKLKMILMEKQAEIFLHIAREQQKMKGAVEADIESILNNFAKDWDKEL